MRIDKKQLDIMVAKMAEATLKALETPVDGIGGPSIEVRDREFTIEILKDAFGLAVVKSTEKTIAFMQKAKRK